jgi:glycosyltransferase involved in cell wall biosynthesis
MILGIDASNIRGGGGVTHLIELLGLAEPGRSGFEKVVIWGGDKTLERISDKPWLKKVNHPALNQGLLRRTIWQRFYLSRHSEKEKCDVLFVPGGSYSGRFKPVVLMSQNLLPFELRESGRYKWSFLWIKFLLLRKVQSRSFKNANGVIFLTEYARDAVEKVTGKLQGKTCVIPHGISTRFMKSPKEQRSINDYSESDPLRILYVSIVDQYKHQWNVVEAVHALRRLGFAVSLELVGPAYPPALDRLKRVMNSFDPDESWAHYIGSVSYDVLHRIYARADIGVFASTCENLPIILLETMGAGLPIACSGYGPMPEVLGDAGIYFDPEKPYELTSALGTLVASPELRAEKAAAGYQRCLRYNWPQSAEKTFDFLSAIADS